MTPAIVLAGHTMALGVVRALAAMGVPVYVVYYEERHIAQRSKFVKKSFRSPHPEVNEAAFVNLLLNEVAKVGRGILFPVSDEAVVAVARNKDKLAEKFVVACPDWTVAERFIDKKITYDLAEGAGVAIPNTSAPRSVAELRGYAERVSYPCIIKPRQSHLFYEHFKRKAFVVENAEEMISRYRQTCEAGVDVLVQEIIPGRDSLVVNYNCYVTEAGPVAEFTAEHTRNGPPGFGSPRVALSRPIPEVIEPGRRILQAMGFAGYACVEFKMDPRDRQYKLMEVNGRHNLSTLLAVRCGMNFPYIEYMHRTRGEMPKMRGHETGVYWIDLLRDAGFTIAHGRREGCSWREYVEPYRKPHVYAIFDLKDPAPFFARIATLAMS